MSLRSFFAVNGVCIPMLVGCGTNRSTRIDVTKVNFGGSTWFAAFEDGNGPWRLAPTPNSNTYSFEVHATSWSFAWACSTGSSYNTMYGDWNGYVEIESFLVAERTSITISAPDTCSYAGPAAGMQLALANPPSNGAVGVAFGPTTNEDVWYPTPPPPPNVYINPALVGTYDLVVAHAVSACGKYPCSDYVVDSAIADRGVSHTMDPTLQVSEDFSHAAAMVSAPVTASPPGSRVRTTLFTTGGTSYPLVDDGVGVVANGFVSNGLAAPYAMADDVYEQQIIAPNATIEDWVSPVAAQTFVAPPVLAAPTSAWVDGASGSFLATSWPSYPDAAGYRLSASDVFGCGIWGNGNQRTCDIDWVANLSPGYFNAAERYIMPDLAALAGWDSELTIRRTDAVTVGLRAMTSSAGIDDAPPVYPAPVGTRRTFASSSSMVAP